MSAEGELAVAKYRDQHRLAYLDDALVNWCADLGTVLANEEVIDGRSERGNYPIKRIRFAVDVARITAYADRLENDLEGVNWSDGIKKLQRDWIGRSAGLKWISLLVSKMLITIGKAGRCCPWISIK